MTTRQIAFTHRLPTGILAIGRSDAFASGSLQPEAIGVDLPANAIPMTAMPGLRLWLRLNCPEMGDVARAADNDLRAQVAAAVRLRRLAVRRLPTLERHPEALGIDDAASARPVATARARAAEAGAQRATFAGTGPAARSGGAAPSEHRREDPDRRRPSPPPRRRPPPRSLRRWRADRPLQPDRRLGRRHRRTVPPSRRFRSRTVSRWCWSAQRIGSRAISRARSPSS